MNVAAFIEYLNKTKRQQIDASYYAKIEKMAAVVAGLCTQRA